ncbi:MAG: class I SAM-dependent methyltransferase [Ruminococcaceae bacterium]|jgi:ubiquinone/menaquinone biosynthesis C-methylase UbiE|nr:class I SAM-dependent methyltransferase [Oscillospiraceae bacterium]
MTAGITQRIKDYWTVRTRDFSAVRQNELRDAISERWLAEMNAYLPQGRPLDILDAGTGTGYFAILLAGAGHRVTGVDMTSAMLAEAEATARQFGASVRFLQADVQATGLEAESFDAVVTRNVTWTLPDPGQAYREWHRLLRPGGVVLNFDANYADNVRRHNQSASRIKPGDVYGHIGVTPELQRESDEITLAMPASAHRRPAWDFELAEAAGFSECGADEGAGARILRQNDLSDAPLFLFRAKK